MENKRKRKPVEKKKRSLIEKVTMVFVWIMIVSTLGGLIFGALSALGLQ